MRMFNVYITFTIIALIFSAIIVGIVNDCQQFKQRLNELKQPVIDTRFDKWFSEHVKQAFDEKKNGN